MIPTTESVTTLASRWAAGDRRAGSELIAKHDSWIRAYARRKALPWEDVDDVAQIMRIAFSRAAISLDVDRTDKEARSFIRNAMLMRLKNERAGAYVRKQNMAHAGVDQLMVGSEDIQNDICDARQIMNRARLTDEERRIVIARCVEDLFQQEIAAELGCSKGTAQRKLSAAISTIRAHSGCTGDVQHRLATASRWSSTCDTDKRVLDVIGRSGTVLGSAIRESLELTRHTYLDSVTRLRKAGLIVASGSHMARAYTLAADPATALP